MRKPSPTHFRLLKTLLFVATLLMQGLVVNVSAQNITVKGHVSKEDGQPVARPSVIVKGTTNGTTGNDNGDYQISAPGNATLVISAVDFATQEIKINNQTTLNVTLITLDKSLGEVIVVGYGTLRSKDVTGSVVKLRGETLREVAAPNLIAQLKGRTAGVDIVSNSSTPGGGGSIRIRGNRTIASSQGSSDALDQPLLVVDGIPYGGSINDINPEDVSNIEILKDASATAIYGSRGAGGVILVTTKRGRVGKPVMSYDAYYGTSSILRKYPVFNGKDYAQFKLDAATYNRSAPGVTSYGLTNLEQAALAAGISTDWQDLIFKHGFTTSHQLSLAGGTELTQYGLSGGYYNETGVIPHQRFERYSLRATIDQKINKRIKVGLNTLNTLSYSNTPGGGGVPSGLVRLTPLAAPYNPDGSVNIFPTAGSVDGPNLISPLTLITKTNAILARSRRLRSFNSLYTEVQFIEGLRYRLNVGLDYRQQQSDSYNGPLTYTNSAASFAQANANVTNAEAWTYVFENLLYYDKIIARKHKVGFTGLFSAQKDHNQQSSFNGLGFPADYVQNSNLALASTVTAVNGGNFKSEQGLLSLMGRLNYGYDNRYLMTFTIRRDGSSVLAPGHQYFTYPAINFGWNAINEHFLTGVSFLSNLKLRGGWGKTGNQGVAPYSTLGALSTSTYNFGQGTNGQQAAYTVTQLANANLHWQSTSQWDVGLDFGLFRNRISGTLDIYKQKTKDILLPYQLPPSNGATQTIKNLGKTEGHGLELNLNSINIQSKSGITWTTDLNFSFNREKITYLTAPNDLANIGNGWFVGQPLTVIYDVKKIGIWQTDDSVKGLTAAQISPVQFPGQIKVEDLNGDHKIDQNDRQILGNFQPKWEGGIENRISYKRFEFSFVLYARMGMKVLIPYLTADGGAQGFPFFMQSRANQIRVLYWTRGYATNEFPAPDAGTDRFLFASTLGYRDGSFIKCRTINLSYDIPGNFLKKAGVTSLKVYATVVNPFIIYAPATKDKVVIDPEGNGYGGQVTDITTGGNVGAGGTGGQGRQISVNANNPTLRQYTFGLNLKF